MVNQERTMTYEEARAEAEKALTWRISGEPLPGDFNAGITVNTLRALLAGPPEPSEEEVARVLQVENMQIVADYGSGNCPVDKAYRRLAHAVQQLYRSRHG